jgi:meso-butanediol dehydrogenase / (S,S)-butanediol dehydrogenase / diacetyl reductase
LCPHQGIFSTSYEEEVEKGLVMNRPGRIQDKVAIITGAASGIGRAAAELFSREGACLVLADWDKAGLTDVVSAITHDGGQVIYQVTDVSDETHVESLVGLAVENHGRVDILCNNAGITGDGYAIDREDLDNWRRVLAVNLLGAVAAVKYVAPIMMAQKSGSIINTASVAGIRAGAGTNAYSASKAAILSFTQTAACDLGGYGVRVNAVCPGLIETGMTKPVFDYAREAGKEHKLGNRCELRRFGRPEEIASVMLFLAGDDSSYMTGQALAVDGGNTASLNLPGMKY